MQVTSSVRAGKLATNHSQRVRGLRVKSNVKAGGVQSNHNQAVSR